MPNDDVDARLTALLDAHVEWAREQHRALAERSPHVTDSVVVIVSSPAGTIPLGCVTMDVLRERVAPDRTELFAALDRMDRKALRMVALENDRRSARELSP